MHHRKLQISDVNNLRPTPQTFRRTTDSSDKLKGTLAQLVIIFLDFTLLSFGLQAQRVQQNN